MCGICVLLRTKFYVIAFHTSCHCEEGRSPDVAISRYCVSRLRHVRREQPSALQSTSHPAPTKKKPPEIRGRYISYSITYWTARHAGPPWVMKAGLRGKIS